MTPAEIERWYTRRRNRLCNFGRCSCLCMSDPRFEGREVTLDCWTLAFSSTCPVQVGYLTRDDHGPWMSEDKARSKINVDVETHAQVMKYLNKFEWQFRGKYKRRTNSSLAVAVLAIVLLASCLDQTTCVYTEYLYDTCVYGPPVNYTTWYDSAERTKCDVCVEIETIQIEVWCNVCPNESNNYQCERRCGFLGCTRCLIPSSRKVEKKCNCRPEWYNVAVISSVNAKNISLSNHLTGDIDAGITAWFNVSCRIGSQGDCAQDTKDLLEFQGKRDCHIYSRGETNALAIWRSATAQEASTCSLSAAAILEIVISCLICLAYCCGCCECGHAQPMRTGNLLIFNYNRAIRDALSRGNKDKPIPRPLTDMIAQFLAPDGYFVTADFNAASIPRMNDQGDQELIEVVFHDDE